MTVTVPGNLLLAGEYAVTEEGGLGIALAVEPRLSVHVQSARRFRLSGIWGRTRVTWPDDGKQAEILDRIVGWLQQSENALYESAKKLHITIDSSAFFNEDGSKRGLGSSAALVVGLMFVLTSRQQPQAPLLLQRCTLLHRALQGGRGSGYDVAASLFGGAGVFTGGSSPNWEPITLPWLAERAVTVVAGSHPVNTAPAVVAYNEWKERKPAAALKFLEDSNRTVSSLAAATDSETAIRILFEARAHGIELGRTIGVPADLPAVKGQWLCKAVGAGNELGLCFGLQTDHANVAAARASHDDRADQNSQKLPGQRLEVSPVGVRIEED